MTSKNLCCNLMKEDLKRRIWTVALLLLTLFFAIVIPVVYMGGQPLDDFADYASWLRNVQDGVIEMVGEGNPFVVMILMAASCVCGVSGFSYLHSAKKVDFYHSIPVRRERLFLASYLNGILIPAVVYLLMLLIAMVAASTFGVGFGVTFGVAMGGYFFHMAFYCLMYTTMVLAMMLTGNIIVALLGMIVFLAYGPLMVILVPGYMSTWLKTFTYSDRMNDRMEFLIGHTSPFSYYITKMDSFGMESVGAVVLTVLLVTALLAFGCCMLYRLRPSESAGRAMAFKKSMAPIKILLVIPFAMGFSLFFYALRSSLGWAVFGVVCGTLIIHCLMEIIYHFDFRKLFANKIHLAVCLAAGLVLLCGFRFDWFGYDSYLPKENQVKSASVYLRSMDDWVSYGRIEEYSRGGYYHWEYESGESYTQEHMKLSQTADVIAMAHQGIQFNEQDMEQSGEPYTRFTVKYTLKNGRTVSRAYSVRREDARELIQRIYDSPEYKQGVYPLLSQTAEETAKVNFQQYDRAMGSVDGAAVAELLEAYQEELGQLTYETRTKELPMGTIQFMTREMDEALKKMGTQEYYRPDLADRCYYPVYPSFQKTLKLLEANGIHYQKGLDHETVSQVEVWDYNKDLEYKDGTEDTQGYLLVTDPKQIDQLAPALVYGDYYYMNGLAQWAQKEEISLNVVMKEDGDSIHCYLDEEKAPDFLKEWMEEEEQ